MYFCVTLTNLLNFLVNFFFIRFSISYWKNTIAQLKIVEAQLEFDKFPIIGDAFLITPLLLMILILFSNLPILSGICFRNLGKQIWITVPVTKKGTTEANSVIPPRFFH